MVDPTAEQKVTLKCHGSGREAIRYHQPMMGVKEYSLTSLELTAENFEPGIYRCRCASSIQGQLNISLPLAVTGEGQGQPRCMHIEVQKCIPQSPHVFAAPPNLCTVAAFSEVTPVQWNLSIKDITAAQLAVLYTVEPLYRGHYWDPAGCPV